MLERETSDGQAAAELVAVVPLLLVAARRWSRSSRSPATRSGAPATRRAPGPAPPHVGGDAEAAALSALPGWLERDAEVDDGAGRSRSASRRRRCCPGVPAIPVSAATELDPGAA